LPSCRPTAPDAQRSSLPSRGAFSGTTAVAGSGCAIPIRGRVDMHSLRSLSHLIDAGIGQLGEDSEGPIVLLRLGAFWPGLAWNACLEVPEQISTPTSAGSCASGTSRGFGRDHRCQSLFLIVASEQERRPKMLARATTIHALAALLVVVASFGAPAQPLSVSGQATAIDGDTLEVSGTRVRLHGIDAPESAQTCRRSDGRSWTCEVAAAERLEQLVEGSQTLRCVGREYDRYGRLIAICRVGDNPVSVNETMVAEGLAWAFARYSNDYVALERPARDARLGVFQGEAEPPWAFRTPVG
jgi:endonuclease YncB( thermonuclease family)